MTLEALESNIDGCRRGDRSSQKQIYRQFFALGMSVCSRYARRREEAEEMCNDGFVRAFSNIKNLEKPAAIIGWLRQIFVRAAIDHYRKYSRAEPRTEPLDEGFLEPSPRFGATQNEALDRLGWEEKLRLVQALPPAYRVAFNLLAIEEMPTAEAAQILQIAEGTLRGNLAKARARLREMIENEAFLIKKSSKTTQNPHL